ncbi:pilus assembly protein [Azotobacter chroococcum]|uniref:TadE/TadG family type IV pilus assembly protein n=1 Tax=Azotobacter chroococcum TaxID=353 RepID=UPI00103C86B0|nr:TadE/TadG family type IV pilus assembly protein [Azotobacter chroococcum]TBW10712.1 pilus assembly protein [Azotobacter chroococcum]
MGRKHMQGVYVVEFALVGLLLFVLLFGVLEMGRLYFTVNAMSEVVRRGARLAAVCDPTTELEQQKVLRRAIFNAATSAGASSLIPDLQTSRLDLIYLDKDGGEVAGPNSVITTEQFRSIRFVRLRVDGFPFNLLIPGFDGAITLPTFQATLPRESLGRHAESDPDIDPITPC